MSWDLGHLRGEPIGPLVSSDGTVLHVEALGVGPPVVFVHGFCLNLASWHFQLASLAEERRVVVYDQRGHGLSAFPSSGDFSIETLARDLATVIDAIGEPVTVVGHSMGGMTLLRYATMFPDRMGETVRGVVLVDTNVADVLGGLLPGAARLALPALRLIEMVAAASPDRLEGIRRSQQRLVRVGVRLMSFAPGAPLDRIQFVERMFASVPARSLVRVVATLRTMNVRAGLDALDVPTLVMVGARDRITPPGVARDLAMHLDGAEFVSIAGAGHMPMLEKPDEFNEALRTFLDHPGVLYGGRRIKGARAPQIAPD